jgi:dihydroorotase (multifunctional complex type)
LKTLLKNCQTLNGLKNILIIDDKIGYIGNELASYDKIIDIGGLWVIPGIIDPHVHVRDLQQSEKEDWNSCSNAAINGGISTIFDMPNTIPATTNLANLNLKRKVAGKTLINKLFYLGATNQNANEIEEMLSENPHDIAGIKIFLAGTSSNDVLEKNKIEEIFEIAKKYDKVVAVHTELQSCLDKWRDKISEKTIQNHNILRNRECAINGTKLVLDMAQEIGNKLYICHVSTLEEIELIADAKTKNTNIFCEVTPHHLFLDETILAKCGNFGKINPPLRTRADNIALMKAIENGTIDTIGTDHAPHTLAEKKQIYAKAPSGFPGLETVLPLLLNAVNNGKISIEKIVELTSFNVAKIFNLPNRGKIEAGYFADLTIIDIAEKWEIDSLKFHSKAKYSPFDGMDVCGKVKLIFVNGKKIYCRERR